MSGAAGRDGDTAAGQRTESGSRAAKRSDADTVHTVPNRAVCRHLVALSGLVAVEPVRLRCEAVAAGVACHATRSDVNAGVQHRTKHLIGAAERCGADLCDAVVNGAVCRLDVALRCLVAE